MQAQPKQWQHSQLCYGLSAFIHNVPSPIPGSWLYPNPGPTNPKQYWIEQ